MADIELVIKIPQHYYENNIKKELPICLTEKQVIAIVPKGHGRLVDISPYEKYEKNCDPWELERYVGKHIKMTETVSLSDIPTVVDADVERE